MITSEVDGIWADAANVIFGEGTSQWWRDDFNGDGYPPYVEMDKFLGVFEYRTFFKTPSRLDRPMPDDLRNLLTMICGPHGKAILKAYRIKKDLV